MQSVHQSIDVARVSELADAMPQVEDVARPLTVAIENAADFGTNRGGSAEQRIRVDRLPCKATRWPTRARASDISVVQSSPTPSQPLAAMCSSHWPPFLVNRITGTRLPSLSGLRPATICSM